MLPLFWTLVGLSLTLWVIVDFRLRFLADRFPSLDASTPVDAPPAWPSVSIVVPARNEARDLPGCLASLLAQDYPAMELIVVDDESTDRTFEVAEQVLRDRPHARALRGRPRPSPDWLGKSWALTEGVESAKGEWLLFIDADIDHHPSTVRKAVADALRRGVDAYSIMPTIECHSLWDRITMPLFALLCGLVEPLDYVNHPERRGARLSGAFILIRREVYDRIGGHAAVAGEILEDMALGERLKAFGRPAWLTYTHDLTRTRMYDSYHDLWQGLVRLSFPMMHYRVSLLLLAYAAAFVGTLVPWLCVPAGVALGLLGRDTGWALAAAGLALGGYTVWVVRKVFRLLREPLAFALLLPLGAHIYCLAATWSAIRHALGKGVGWKSRVYGG